MVRRVEKYRTWHQIPLSLTLSEGLPTLMVGEKGPACCRSPCSFLLFSVPGPLVLILAGTTLQGEPRIQCWPWSCAQEGCAGILGFCVASFFSPASLLQVWALPLKCRSKGQRRTGSELCAWPRDGSRSPSCSGELSVVKSS